MSSSTFAGRLFGPGFPGAGAPATARWNAEGNLCVAGPEQKELIVGDPEISAGGFNDTSLRISWQEAGGAYAFIIEGEAERRACILSAPARIGRHLSNADDIRTRLERRFRFGGMLLALILALPLLGIAIFLSNSDHVADWAVEHISPEHERRLGNMVLAQTRLQMKIIDSGPAVDAITVIGSKLTAGSVHRYRWLVADRSDVNAFAAPGGVVVVFNGLLRTAGSAEELAGVLAHEIAHVELRHSLAGMVKSLGLRALISLAIGDSTGSVFTGAATRLMELHFSRDAEREADDHGMRRLIANRIDPSGMLRFYEKLAAKQGTNSVPLLSTHPATGERLEHLRQQVSRQKENWVPLPVDLGAVRREVR